MDYIWKMWLEPSGGGYEPLVIVSSPYWDCCMCAFTIQWHKRELFFGFQTHVFFLCWGLWSIVYIASWKMTPQLSESYLWVRTSVFTLESHSCTLKGQLFLVQYVIQPVVLGLLLHLPCGGGGGMCSSFYLPALQVQFLFFHIFSPYLRRLALSDDITRLNQSNGGEVDGQEEEPQNRKGNGLKFRIFLC
jgi:hypothetical protein